ncbi:hypothetical protein R6Q57_021470 [Mikania cordata]
MITNEKSFKRKGKSAILNKETKLSNKRGKTSAVCELCPHISFCGKGGSNPKWFVFQKPFQTLPVGNFVTETVTFGRLGSVQKVALGCGHDNKGLLVGAAGLLGLGGVSLPLPLQIKAMSFSYCLVDRDSRMASNLEFNFAPPTNSVTAPLLRNTKITTYLYVGLTGISVGGRPLSIPLSIFVVDRTERGGALVDSGTAVTRLQTQAYNSLRDVFKKQASILKPTTGFSLFDMCFDLSSKTRVMVLTVSFNFVSSESAPAVEGQLGERAAVVVEWPVKPGVRTLT